MISLSTLQSPYIIPDLVPTGLRDFVNLTRQIHEGVYLNWLHKTILRLSHLFQIS